MINPDPDSSKEKRLQRLTLGQLGEDLTAQWLQAQGGKILARRWTCRWGELDLVALMPQGTSRFLIAFAEVKTRSRGNWDEGGLLSITPTKQRKLWQSARLYLAQNSRYAALPCRFDVALIRSQKLKPRKQSPQTPKSQTPKSQTPKEKAVPLVAQPDVSNPNFNVHASSPSQSLKYAQSSEHSPSSRLEAPKIGQPVQRGDYRLTLQHYLTDAFRLD